MGNYRKILLVACVAGLSVTYQQVNAHSSLAASVVQQQKGEKIVGIVVDSQTNEVIPGAAVQVKGTHTGVITDVDGKFEIIASRGQVLIISYLGYTPKEIEIDNQKVLTITLSEDAELLDEVVVTAFGTGQKKESVTVTSWYST